MTGLGEPKQKEHGPQAERLFESEWQGAGTRPLDAAPAQRA